MLGFLPQEQLTAELLRAKALVAPSVGMESFGMVLTRAFACAVPVVASDIPGYKAVMTDDTGVLFPVGDSDALAEAVGNLLEDEPRRRELGERARRIAIERYSWDGSPSGSSRSTARSRHEVEGGDPAVPRGLRGDRARVPRGGRRAALVARAALDEFKDAFTAVDWKWVAAAVGLNLALGGRAGGRVGHGDPPAMPPPHPRFGLVFSAFSVGLLANAVLPGRVGELARVAVLTRRMTGRRGVWATLVGTSSRIASSISSRSMLLVV